MESSGVLFIWIILSLFIYFLPTLVASHKKSKNRTSIFVLNLFLGWTLLGWVMALVWSFKTAEETVSINASSEADELIKLKSLLDSGVLSQEEFEVKKRQILNC